MHFNVLLLNNISLDTKKLQNEKFELNYPTIEKAIAAPTIEKQFAQQSPEAVPTIKNYFVQQQALRLLRLQLLSCACEELI